MENLTPAEQELIRKHRADNRLKLERMAQTLRENGYTVVAPTHAVLPDVLRATLSPVQEALLTVLKSEAYRERGATLAEMRAGYMESTGERMTRGASGTAARYLIRKGHAERRGELFYAI
jgi:hypothetical protein